MSNIKPIRGSFTPGEPHGPTIEAIGGILERAKKGEILSVAFACYGANGVSSTGWESADRIPNDLSPSIMALFHRYASRMAD